MSKLEPRRIATCVLCALIIFPPGTRAASNLPSGGAFSAGSGSISATGSSLIINQSSLRGIIDWTNFSLGQGGSVRFNNGAGATLNQVTGGMPSSILGELVASGSVYILNPQGVLIGPGATVHTGGDFLASTLNLSNGAFLNSGPLLFSGSSMAAIVNLGNLSSSGGSIYLIGHSVQNGGGIATPNGTTGLGAGGQILIADTGGNQRVFVQAPGGDITNAGFIHAAQVELRSNGGNIYALAGNNGGQIRATGTATRGGHVWLVAENGALDVSGFISANDANGSGGLIETSGAHVSTNGAQISTGKGGNWLLDPADLIIDSPLAGSIESALDAGTNVTEQTGSGHSGNGDITVASNIAWTGNANLTLSAFRNIGFNSGVVISNTGAGNLTLRADNTATGVGSISFSGPNQVDFSASSGTVSLLYNPSSYATPTDYSLNVATNGGWTAPADGSVVSQMTAYMLVNNTANLQNLDANDAGFYALGKDIDASGIASFVPLGSSAPYFTGTLDGQGHTISNLSVIASNANAGLFAQIGAGGQVRNLNLSNVNITDPTSSLNDVGALAGVNNGAISNVSSAGAITTGTLAYYIGGLVGWNTGTIQNSSSSVAVDASQTNGIILTPYAGGLVGYNQGPVSNSHASGSVLGAAGTVLGGLVGVCSATIANSYATGSVSDDGGGSSYIGGLVGGVLTGSISDSFATGAATGGMGSYVGGLVGAALPGVTIANSYATSAVTGGSGSIVGGLVGIAIGGVTVSTSYALGSATGGTDSVVGGLVGGFEDGTVGDSYARGPVSAGSGSTVGGLIGVSSNQATVSSYSSGLVTAPGSTVGGLIGAATEGAIIASSYWDTQASGQSVGFGSADNTVVGAPTGRTTAQLQSGMIPAGFNASNSAWFAPAGVYPYLAFQGPLVTISGTAYSGNGVLSSAGVAALSAGFLLGSVATNPSGFYTLSEPSNMVSSGVLTYLTSGAANTFSDGVNGFTGMDLHSGTLSFINGVSGTLSGLNAALSTTLGSYTGANFLVSPGGGQLNLTDGTNLAIASSASAFTLDESISGAGNIYISSAGRLSIGGAGALMASAGSNITLVTGSSFVNKAGPNALGVSGGGRWLVYSQNPSNDDVGGLSENFKQYNANYGSTIPAQSGNGLLYTLAPTITANLTGLIAKTYDGTNYATLSSANVTTAGALAGDTVSVSTGSATYADPNVNSGIGVTAPVSISSANSGSIPVYGYQMASSTASGSIGVITPATLTFISDTASRFQGMANPIFTGSVSGFVNGQTRATATTGSALFSSPAGLSSAPGTYAINGSGLTANYGDYVFVQAAGNASALVVTPAVVTAPLPTPTPAPVPAPMPSPITVPLPTSTLLNLIVPTNPLIPPFLPAPTTDSFGILLQPTNASGLFEMDLSELTNGLSLQQPSLSEACIPCGADKRTAQYWAGAKP